MKQILRVTIGVVIGLATLLTGQLLLENLAWWWTGDTGALESPLSIAVKFAVAGAAGLAVGTMIVLRPARGRNHL